MAGYTGTLLSQPTSGWFLEGNTRTGKVWAFAVGGVIIIRIPIGDVGEL